MAALPACARPTLRTAPELELKATYLLNFLRFVRRSEAPLGAGTDPIPVAVLGDEDLAGALRQVVKGKHIDGREIVVHSPPEPDHLTEFDMVFFGVLSSSRLGLALEQTRGAPVLTVGESDDFVDRGGMIGLFFEDRRLRFSINADAAEQAGLRFSSSLLSLAAEVRSRRR